jgi:beta-lactam-binding protein with PASTA domain
VRVCRSCGRENADEMDFCACGEYLRWEPTNLVPAVAAPVVSPSAPAAADGAAPAKELDPNLTVAPDVAAPAPPAPGTPGSGGAPPGSAALILRLPEDDSAYQGVVSLAVEPGARATMLGLIRNQSDVVDNFDLTVRGLPEDWWTVAPATAYLVPYGTGGTYEQEIQIHIHPPRSPEAQARPWSFEVVAASRTYGGEVAAAAASVTIGPYFDVATELRPERASGRLKARYKLIVRNKANARTEVGISAEDTDAECQFRFAAPSVALEPGNAMECPFTVFPPSQIWIGRTKEHRFQVTALPIGVELKLPPPPRIAVYRQRSWLPWWLAVVVPIAVALAVVTMKLLPKQTVVPPLKGLPSAFAAQQLLNKAGLKLAQTKPMSKVDATKPPGSIANQSPSAGTKVKKGEDVSVVVYTGTGLVPVPSVIGDTPGQADRLLRASRLALGVVSPQPLNPNGKIYSQIPLGTGMVRVPVGMAVAVFLNQPHTVGKGGAPVAKNGGAAGVTPTGTAAAAATAAVVAAAAKSAGSSSPKALAAVAAEAGTGSIMIPALQGDPTAAAAKLSQLGLSPAPVEKTATVPIGQVAGTVPAAGAKVAKGASVDLLISTGSPPPSPLLAYDDNQGVQVIDSTTQKAAGVIPAGSAQEEASWSFDGRRLVYSQNGQLMLLRPSLKGGQPSQLTQAPSGMVDLDPSFAPTGRAYILAFIQRTTATNNSQLCFALVGPNLPVNPSCATPPTGWDIGEQISWSKDGSHILVYGSLNHGANFGLIQFHSNLPFSTQASQWGHGTLVTNASMATQGVFAGAFSPNGKLMALVTGSNSDGYFLSIVPVGDFNPSPADQLPEVRACQISWRSDSQALAVMQPDGVCEPTALGTIVLVDLRHPGTQTFLAAQAAHPSLQPVPTGG